MVIGILSSEVGLGGGLLPVSAIVLQIMELISVSVMLMLSGQLKIYFQKENL
jgi:hypothetical protein